MAAISRRGQDGRIYNNTRARVLQRRKCVKPADLTTHSPPKAVTRPRTATRPARALSLPHAARCIPHRPHNPFPTEDLPSPPHSDTPFPSTSAPPRSPDARPQAARCTPAGCTMHARSAQCIPRCPHNSFPAENLRTPTHSDTPSPSTSYRPLSPNARPRSADARPQAVRCIPHRPHHPFSTEALRSPPHSDTPFPSTSDRPRSADARPRNPDTRPPTAHPIPRRRLPLAPAAPTRPSRALPPPTQRRRTPAGCAMHSPQPSQLTPRRRPSLAPFCSASGTKKRHRTVHVRCRMSRSTVVAVGHLGW